MSEMSQYRSACETLNHAMKSFDEIVHACIRTLSMVPNVDVNLCMEFFAALGATAETNAERLMQIKTDAVHAIRNLRAVNDITQDAAKSKCVGKYARIPFQYRLFGENTDFPFVVCRRSEEVRTVRNVNDGSRNDANRNNASRNDANRNDAKGNDASRNDANGNVANGTVAETIAVPAKRYTIESRYASCNFLMKCFWYILELKSGHRRANRTTLVIRAVVHIRKRIYWQNISAPLIRTQSKRSYLISAQQIWRTMGHPLKLFRTSLK